MHVEACALGQASAALLARYAPGLGLAELRAARDGIASWFAGAEVQPDWPGFDLLAPAQGYPARHGAILLPFDAAIAALEERAAAA
jgi:NifU-like protein involved in Fe-S cluster formation